MDGPQPTESKIARDEGFIIRTRVNTGRFSDQFAYWIFQARSTGVKNSEMNFHNTKKVMEADNCQRYQDNLDTGSQVISFDRRYDYVWLLFEDDQRCDILDEQKYGKVCKWSEKPEYEPENLCKNDRNKANR